MSEQKLQMNQKFYSAFYLYQNSNGTIKFFSDKLTMMTYNSNQIYQKGFGVNRFQSFIVKDPECLLHLQSINKNIIMMTFSESKTNTNVSRIPCGFCFKHWSPSKSYIISSAYAS